MKKEKDLFNVLDIEIEEPYYYICYENFYRNFYISEDYNYNLLEDNNSEKMGNVFKTREEAEKFIKELEKLFIERKQKLLGVG